MEVGPPPPHRGQCPLAVKGRFDRPVLAQQTREVLAHVRVVVDDQEMCLA